MGLGSCVLAALVAASLCVSGHCARHTKYYDVLGVTEDSSDEQIRKAYRKAAMKWHPDRNPDDVKMAEEKFREVAQAYEVLSDPEKRKMYDQFGEDGPAQAGADGGFHFQGGHDPMDIFNTFFGGKNPFEGMGMGGADGSQTFHFEFQSGDGGAGGFESLFGGGGGEGGGGFESLFGGMGGGGSPGGGFAGFPGAQHVQFGDGGVGGFDMGGFDLGGFDMGGFGMGGERGAPRGLYEGDPHVQTLTADDFPRSWESSLVVIQFYKGASKASRQAAPIVRKLAAATHGVIRVAAVDCDQEPELCREHGVKKFPTLKAFVPHSKDKKLPEFKQDPTHEGLKRWAFGLIPDLVHAVATDAQLRAFLQTCGAAAAAGAKVRRASWNLCVLLVTPKGEASPLYKSLSSQYKDQVSFAQVSSSNKMLKQQLNVSEATTVLLSICNGDVKVAERYTDEMKSRPLKAFLGAFVGGKKCRKAVKLDASTDFSSMRIGELKNVLIDQGVRCLECLEKKDYIDFLKAHVSRAAS